MKFTHLLTTSIFIIFFSCVTADKTESSVKTPVETKHIKEKAFQNIIDKANVAGAILVYDVNEHTYYSNDFEQAKTSGLPASTYKIPNSIIALETGVVDSDSTLFEWDGEDRALDAWEQDLFFRDAFHFSCVPCYQQVARMIGAKRMNAYLTKFNYGNMQVDSSTIDLFWLQGGSKINTFEQIDFLQRFYLSELPISERTEQIMKRMMVIEQTENFSLSGKTGWAIREGKNKGWFVGYIEKGEQLYYFAAHISPKEGFDMKLFPKVRKEITLKALRSMGI